MSGKADYVSPAEGLLATMEQARKEMEGKMADWLKGSKKWVPSQETYEALLAQMAKTKEMIELLSQAPEKWHREITRIQIIHAKEENAKAFYESQGFGKSASTSASAPAAKPASTAAAFGPGSAKSAGSAPPAAAMSALSLDPK